MPRIAWVTDPAAIGPVADAFDSIRATSRAGDVPDIARTMSLQPEFMMAIMQAAKLHFNDGALSRAQHEMIASYVAALNHCHY